MKQYDYLIVGAGLFGAVFAQQATKAGKSCLLRASMSTAMAHISSILTIKKCGTM